MAEQLIPYKSGVQYDGSNGAAIVAQIPAQQVSDYNVHIISESGGTLVLGYEDAGPNSFTYATGDWVVWDHSFPYSLPDDELSSTYIKRSDLP